MRTYLDLWRDRRGLTTVMSMRSARATISGLISRGVLNPGWYSVLTGLALLYVAYLLGSVSGDPAAPWVAIALAVTGLWQLERGLRADVQRRAKPTDEAS